MQAQQFPDITPAQLDKLTIICTAIAQRHLKLFADDPAVTLDDLIQVALFGCTINTVAGAIRAHAEYQPPASYTSWIGQRASAAILDLRKKTRAANRLQALAQQTTKSENPEQSIYAIPTFTEILKIVPDGIPRRLNRERGGAHGADAYARTLAYREAHSLSWSQLHARLTADPALVKALGFVTPPALSSICLARKRLHAWAKSLDVPKTA